MGLDNGDSTDYDSYKGISRRLFSGKLMAIIGATLEPGKIKLRVSSKGFEEPEAVFESFPVKDRNFIEGISAIIENQDMPIVWAGKKKYLFEKSNLSLKMARVLLRIKKRCLSRPIFFRKTALIKDSEWNIVNDAGIELNIAQIEKLNLEEKALTTG